MAHPEATQRFIFNIPSLQLEEALIRYGELVGTAALYPSQLLTGLRSTALQGSFTQEEALIRLLHGTGLHIEKQQRNTGTVYRLRGHTDFTSRTKPHALASMDGYLAYMQQAIVSILCHRDRTAPGSYTALLRLSIQASGRVYHAELLDSSGSADRDRAIMQQLGQLHLKHPPRERVLVPYLIRLSPLKTGDSAPCIHRVQP